jgi:hypothetical protein
MNETEAKIGQRGPARLWRAAVLAGLGALAVVAAPSAGWAEWCAIYQNGGINCGFSNHAQCLAAISGVGGTCSPSGERSPARQSERPPRKPAKPTAAKPRTTTPAKPEAPAARKPAAAPDSASRTEPKPQTPPGALPPASAPATAAPLPAAAVDFAGARQLVLGGQYAAGLAALRALNFDDHPDVATYVGLAHRKLGRLDEARTWYERALVADPNHKLALSFYGIMLAETGDVAGARSNLARIGRLCGNTDCNEYQALQAVIGSSAR